jgi:hypothetical protein
MSLQLGSLFRVVSRKYVYILRHICHSRAWLPRKESRSFPGTVPMLEIIDWPCAMSAVLS